MSLRVHPGLAPLGVVASLAQRIEPCLSQVGQVERVRLPQDVLAERWVQWRIFQVITFATLACGTRERINGRGEPARVLKRQDPNPMRGTVTVDKELSTHLYRGTEYFSSRLGVLSLARE